MLESAAEQQGLILWILVFFFLLSHVNYNWIFCLFVCFFPVQVSKRRMHLPFFCKSLSECKYIFCITITVLKISQNNDDRGRHLEFYFHKGNWFQCFPVYPDVNLSSGSDSDSGSGSGCGSVSGSGSGFRLFHTPVVARLSCWTKIFCASHKNVSSVFSLADFALKNQFSTEESWI